MVDELTPTRGVDSDDFPGYSLVYVPISVYAVSITVLAHSYSVSAPNCRARSPLVLRANSHSHRYAVLPVWTSTGDPASSALQAPSRTHTLTPSVSPTLTFP